MELSGVKKLDYAENKKQIINDNLKSTNKEITTKEEISINQFIISAVAEKISALETQNYLEKRAERSSRNKFMAVLAKVPDTEPADYDR